MKSLVNIETLPEAARKRIVPFCEQMLQLHGETIESMVVYGSATGLNFVPKRSDVNLLIVVSELGYETLRQSLRLVDRGIKKKIAAPLFLTRQNIERSLDVFPIEFLEMKENHVVIYGEDPLEGIEMLLKESLSALIPTFRAMLRLKGLGPIREKEKVIDALASQFNVDGQAFLEVLHDQQADEKIGKQDAETFFGKYLEALDQLTVAVDRLFEGGE